MNQSEIEKIKISCLIENKEIITLLEQIIYQKYDKKTEKIE